MIESNRSPQRRLMALFTLHSKTALVGVIVLVAPDAHLFHLGQQFIFNLFIGHRLFMTAGTLDLFVASFKGEFCIAVVIKKNFFPGG
jgi:hypothetical protein